MLNIKYLLFLSALLLWQCKGEEKNNDMNPPGGMIREQHPPATTVSENYNPGPPTAGNFDGLVSDFESKQRAIWQKPDLVISLLGDLKGKSVADIGAGTGYFTFRLVPKADKVIGIDIDQRFISFMDSVKVRLPKSYQDRFETRMGKAENPCLKPKEVNAVVIVNTYGYIENRVKYLQLLSDGLADDNKLLIIDFKKNNLPVGPSSEFKVSTGDVKKELTKAGFTVDKIDTQSLDYQYIVLASFKRTKTE
jgi:SAM-dependent methyltransferase